MKWTFFNSTKKIPNVVNVDLNDKLKFNYLT